METILLTVIGLTLVGLFYYYYYWTPSADGGPLPV